MAGFTRLENYPTIMKILDPRKTSASRITAKPMTLGDLIAATYRACGKQKARHILQLALVSNIVRLKHPMVTAVA